MSIHLHWFLPTAGDSRSVAGWGATDASRPADLGYLTQVAQAADRLGFDAVLTPTGTFCEDAWISTAALLAATERLRFLVAFRPGLISPTLAAQQAATFQRMSGGRLLLNVVTGASEVEQRRFGDHLSKDERYARCDEFLEVLRGCWSEAGLDFTGDHFRVEDARVADPDLPRPPIFFGGSSDAALRVAARQSDVWLMWGEPLEAAAEELARVRALAEAEGRTLEGLPYLETFLVASIDAALAAQNAVVAAESLGLSTVYIGALRNDVGAVAELLNLPPGAAGVFGLCVGYAEPAAAGEVKPRLPQDAVLHHGTYRIGEERAQRAAYDQAMGAFSRRNEMQADTWTERVLARIASIRALRGRDRLKPALRALGFPLQ